MSKLNIQPDRASTRFSRRIMMTLPMLRVLTVSIPCLVAAVGCNRSNNSDATLAKADAEVSRGEAQGAKAELAKVQVELATANAEQAKQKTPPAAPAQKPDPDKKVGKGKNKGKREGSVKSREGQTKQG